MNIRLPLLLGMLTSLVCVSQHVVADDLTALSIRKSSNDDHYLVVQRKKMDQVPVIINADTARATYPDQAIFSGHVEIQQGRRHFTSKHIQLNRRVLQGDQNPTHTIVASGNVCYDDHQIILNGLRAWSNLNTKDTNIWHSNYQMVDRQGRGVATQIKLRNNNRYTILENGTFTSCPMGQDSWMLKGSQIIYDRHEQLTKIWNARFQLGVVPVFYSPYLNIPVGNKRRSGLLMPHAYYNKISGAQFLFPYYWNILPEVDATLVAHYISRRGMQWQNELRYLTGGKGLVEVDYLHSDRFYRDNHKHVAHSSTRWLVHWEHAGIYSEHWRFNSDYTKVSDPYYFTDLQSAYGTTSDDYSTQKFVLGYRDRNWGLVLSTKRFQMLSLKDQKDIYYSEPQMDFNYHYRNFKPLEAYLYAQAVRFTNMDARMPNAIRLHMEPVIKYSLENKWNTLQGAAKLLMTHYEQHNIQYYNKQVGPIPQLKGSFHRILPQLTFDGRMLFSRDISWLPGYRQTLEPRAQYLYIPYRNQSWIRTYDSALLGRDYDGLFREKTYSGLDRITSANQAATGITMRILNAKMLEKFKISIGQIYLFNSERSILGRANDNTKGSLVLAGDSYWRMSDRIILHAGMQYDVHIDSITQGNTILEWRYHTSHMIQCSYRYTSADYMKKTLEEGSNEYQYRQGISQVGAIATWPIINACNTWSVVGAFYYDLKNKMIADQLVGMQYSSCCYAVRFGYERKVNGWEQNQSKYDNQISFNIELRGLSPGHDLDMNQMLRQGMMPYRKIF
ncbi:LPS-assembly protein LptD [Candidatus Erwinia haradaeae]|uniref:LPS-assembly protein LptD n=1 Tax=Candidatus Erwinia haradaeae TaxID=1922217 RepID=A0A451DDI2_9GAMM|nr:LPS assembly protein LptD [Candidatus Erwinia haradaeae]VFP84542.1 LPS-assembly protein LptD [Candidatus Erwinia haradaeae]